jgi:hypothetical protein
MGLERKAWPERRALKDERERKNIASDHGEGLIASRKMKQFWIQRSSSIRDLSLGGIK